MVGIVARGGTEIVITKNDRPIFRLVPFREQPKRLFAIDKERIEIFGDIISPVNVKWEARIGRTEDGD